MASFVHPAKHHCQNCGGDAAQIVDSRPSADPNVIRRRRYACTECGARTTTHEVVAKGAGSPQESMSAFLKGMKALAREHFGDEAATGFSKGNSHEHD